MQKYFMVLFASLFFVLNNIAAATSPKKASSPSLATLIDTKADAYDQFLQASYLHAKGDNEKALKAFDGIMQTRPSEDVFEPYLQALFDAERFATVIKVYERNKKKIDPLLKKNPMTKAFVAQAYLSTGKQAKAQALFDTLLQEHGNDVQMCYFIAVGYLKTKRHPAAIKVLQDCVRNEALKNKHYLFHFLLSKAYLELDKAQAAMASIEASIAQFPKFERGWLFKAILHEQQGKISEAISGYKKFLDLTGRDQSIEKQLVQLLFAQQRFSEAADYLQKLSNDSPEYCFDLALVQGKSGDYTAALTNVNKVLAQNPALQKARLLKIEVLLNSDQTDAALSTLCGWLNEEPQSLGTLHMFLLLKQGGIAATRLLPALEEVQQKHPNNLGILAVLGDLALEAEQSGKALDFYDQALQKATHKKLRSKIYFQKCYILFEQKNNSALQAELEKVEKEDCTSHALLNLKAYHLAQSGQDLSAALGAVDHALALKPGEAAYLDTKALILHKMQKPKEALHFAQKALSLAPNDSIIRRNAKEIGHYAHTPRKQFATDAMRSGR